MAKNTNIEIQRGSTNVFAIEATDDAGLFDFTGSKLQFMVKKKITDLDADAIVNLELLAFPLGMGLAEFTISAANAALLPVGQFVYAYQLIDPAGIVAETEAGQCTVKADVHQGTT